jgi:hypothetical protein
MFVTGVELVAGVYPLILLLGISQKLTGVIHEHNLLTHSHHPPPFRNKN